LLLFSFGSRKISLATAGLVCGDFWRFSMSRQISQFTVILKAVQSNLD